MSATLARRGSQRVVWELLLGIEYGYVGTRTCGAKEAASRQSGRASYYQPERLRPAPSRGDQGFPITRHSVALATLSQHYFHE